MGAYTNMLTEAFEWELAKLIEQALDAGLDGRTVQSALIQAAQAMVADLDDAEALASGYASLSALISTRHEIGVTDEAAGASLD
jgi:hypothetical protein